MAKEKGKTARKGGKLGCRHTILYAYGRTATSTICKSLMASTHTFQYCKGVKEAYGLEFPSSSSLQDCVRKAEARGKCAFIDVKPGHIDPKRLKKGRKDIHDQHTFWAAAKSAGFDSVSTTFRENVLAGHVSSEELAWAKKYPKKMVNNPKKHDLLPARLPTFTSNSVSAIDESIALYNDGYRAAVDHGLKPIYYSFSDFLSKPCDIMQMLSKRFSVSGLHPIKFKCKVLTAQTDSSHPTWTLAQRIGKKPAQRVTMYLTGSPYEWMLNLHTAQLPAGRHWKVDATPMYVTHLHDEHYTIAL